MLFVQNRRRATKGRPYGGNFTYVRSRVVCANSKKASLREGGGPLAVEGACDTTGFVLCVAPRTLLHLLPQEPPLGGSLAGCVR